MRLLPVATALVLALAACASEPSQPAGNAQAPAADANSAPTSPSLKPRPASPAPSTPAANVLTLDGLDALRIGRPVPAGSSWAERGAQISDECRLIGSPDYPGVYAITEGGRVRRITLGQGSQVRLAEGIGVGASEAEVRADFAGFREEPHEYVEAPGKYLTAPNAASGQAALRFEIGADGKVSLVHVGTMPVLGYVEGCA